MLEVRLILPILSGEAFARKTRDKQDRFRALGSGFGHEFFGPSGVELGYVEEKFLRDLILSSEFVREGAFLCCVGKDYLEVLHRPHCYMGSSQPREEFHYCDADLALGFIITVGAGNFSAFSCCWASLDPSGRSRWPGPPV